eukprot:1857871-Pyramimonas_sp.AAC.1
MGRSPGSRARLDRHGLEVKIDRVPGCTSRTWRQNLESRGQVHLCRVVGCATAHPMHVDQCAAIDHTQLVDLAEHGKPTVWRVAGVGLRKVLRVLRWILGGFVWAFLCWLRRRRPEQRLIGDSTGRRELAFESESEIDQEDRPRQAARAGVQTSCGARPLQTQGCSDRALEEPTVLL